MTNEIPLAALSDAVGARVRHVREQRRWSVEQVAEACAEAGATHLTVASLYALESGRREKGTGRRRRLITVDELLALSYVLGVHPVDLIVPSDLGPRDEFKIAPNVTTTAGNARDWIAGFGFMVEPESRIELHEMLRWSPAARAEYISERWFPPRHLIAREADRVRQQSKGIAAADEAGALWPPLPRDDEEGDAGATQD